MRINRKKRALFSVSAEMKVPKLVEQVKRLAEIGWEILGSAGTARYLTDKGVQTRNIAGVIQDAVIKQMTAILDKAQVAYDREGLETLAREKLGEPILGHQVVTICREIAAAILAREEISKNLDDLEVLGVDSIDLVFNSLYALEAEIERDGSDLASVKDKTDIGGRLLLMLAAKRKIVVFTLEDLEEVVTRIQEGQLDNEFINALAGKAEARVADYSLALARYLSGGKIDGQIGTRVYETVYSENPHQGKGGAYSTGSSHPLAFDRFRLINQDGKTTTLLPSYINWTDFSKLMQFMVYAGASFHLNRDHLRLSRPVPFMVAWTKHGIITGAAFGDSPADAIKKAIECDTVSVKGAWLTTNFPIGEEEVILLRTHALRDGETRRNFDGVIAPEFSEFALTTKGLARTTGRCRFVANPALTEIDRNSLFTDPYFLTIPGGFLRQERLSFLLDLSSRMIRKYGTLLSTTEEEDLLLAAAICASSDSNCTVLALNRQLIGNGHSQPNRELSCWLACQLARRNGFETEGALAATDSFFVEGPQELVDAGVRGVFAPFGSENDNQVIDFCLDNGLTLYQLDWKIARLFSGHH